MDHHPILDACPLFAGLSTAERRYALDYFSARRQRYARGDFLHKITFPLPRFGLVLEGTVQVCRDDIDGHQMIMNNVGPGGTFGESYCFLGTDAPIYIRAMQETEVLWLSTDRIKCPLQPVQPLDQELANRFVAALARRALEMNRRIQILSKTTLRGKLIAFLSQYAPAQDAPFTVPFDRASMAAFLGADRSALSRELGRMQAEGILTFHRNVFRLLPRAEDQSARRTSSEKYR